MSESMVERVARALCRADGGRDPDHESNDAFDEGQKQWTLYVGDARAAIEAMRMPTTDMIEAGANIVLDYAEFVGAKDLVKRVQIGMIDAALSPAKVDEAG